MSSTRELSVALDYSGVKHGKVGTVLPPPPSPLSVFAAFFHRSSTKACRCTTTVAKLKHVVALAKHC